MRKDVRTPLAAHVVVHEEAWLALRAAAHRRAARRRVRGLAAEAARVEDQAAIGDLALRSVGAVVDAVPEGEEHDPRIRPHVLRARLHGDVRALGELGLNVEAGAVQGLVQLPPGLALTLIGLHAGAVAAVGRWLGPTLAERVVAESASPAWAAAADVRGDCLAVHAGRDRDRELALAAAPAVEALALVWQDADSLPRHTLGVANCVLTVVALPTCFALTKIRGNALTVDALRPAQRISAPPAAPARVAPATAALGRSIDLKALDHVLEAGFILLGRHRITAVVEFSQRGQLDWIRFDEPTFDGLLATGSLGTIILEQVAAVLQLHISLCASECPVSALRTGCDCVPVRCVAQDALQ
mmetsp:Transcript_173249/g.555683  ORF Transcript_173249/g.555683 Transcript_173249/m.555683 type:complete len:357 (-) Transcript_173249:734-1804(-)